MYIAHSLHEQTTYISNWHVQRDLRQLLWNVYMNNETFLLMSGLIASYILMKDMFDIRREKFSYGKYALHRISDLLGYCRVHCCRTPVTVFGPWSCWKEEMDYNINKVDERWPLMVLHANNLRNTTKFVSFGRESKNFFLLLYAIFSVV